MTYSNLQQRIYENKVRRGFNVTDVGKELILMGEEYGELCNAVILMEEQADEPCESGEDANRLMAIDAVGDLMVYCLGMSAMFKWNANEIWARKVKLPRDTSVIGGYLPYVGRELGWLNKNYKRSNKREVDEINCRDFFNLHLGNLMGYCSEMFEVLKVEEFSVLEQIVKNNETRTHEGQI